ncbi:ATP-binding protein [Natronosalvus vescus]|uniref:ATP-binding protein n=1 Tax=Natronosalvus vescus TaxID=2953881 RepID=UPI0020914E78|nr:ATP-binding protein [Natronosalvus vescus]
MTSPVHVVIVAGDATLASQLRAALTDGKAPIEVCLEPDPQAAIARAADHVENPVDCLVATEDLGSTTGLDILEAIRRTRPGFPGVFVTDGAVDAITRMAHTEKATDYVFKQSVAAGTGELQTRIVQTCRDADRNETDRHERILAERTKELSAIHQAAELLLSTDQPFESLLEEFVNIVRRAFWSPALTDVRVAINDRVASTGTFDTGEHSILATETTSDGTVVELEVVHHDDPETPTSSPFLEEEQHLIETLLTLFAGRLERQQYVAELERARELFHNAEKLGKVGAWEIDFRTDDLYWTDGTRRIHDVPLSYEPTLQKAFAFYHPEDRERVESIIAACRETGETISGEFRLVTAQNAEKYVHIYGEPVTDETQDVTYRGYIQDLTESVQRTYHIDVLDRMLRHNLRNDLNIVSGYAEEIASRGDRTVAESAAHLQRTVSKLLDSVNKGRKASKILFDTQRPTSIDLTEAIPRWARDLQRRHPGAEITITPASTDSPLVAVSPGLRQAVTELVENSVEHSDRDTPHVQLDLEANAETIEIHVRDDGPGIPRHERTLVLDDVPVSPLEHSSGIGLWLTKLLVDRTGGMLSFPDDQSNGGVVTITLPRDEGSDRPELEME